MPHLRKRHLLEEVQKQAKYWPVIAVLGLRQSGKSTLLRGVVNEDRQITLDDVDALEDVHLSSKNFLAKLGTPVVIDQVQKAPALFDAIKLRVDLQRRPGQYYLTGSSQFSAQIGIRESLTGRIGIHYLYPFTLAETFGKPLDEARIQAWHKVKVRFSVEEAVKRLSLGGLPVPLFARDPEIRRRYFENWIETAVIRDAARTYGKGYDPDVSWSILRQMGQTLREGELPTLNHFRQSSRKLRRYLDALENIFLLRKIPCHELGVGKEVWMITDGGLARPVMGSDLGEGSTLSLARIFLLNELLSNSESAGNRIRPVYYKTARGGPVDLVWNDSILKVSIFPKSQTAYDQRPLQAALKKLRLKKSFLVTLRDEVVFDGGAGMVPLTYWS
jgi:predicted AAA+ superfamily ATPase